MTYDLGMVVFGQILNYFPSFYEEGEKEDAAEVAKKVIYIGINITYDACVRLNNLAVAMCGLTIIRFVYHTAKENEMQDLMAKAHNAHEELKEHFTQRKLQNALELLSVFKNDLDSHQLAFPHLHEHLMKIVYEGRKN
jgi:hypothetical protein